MPRRLPLVALSTLVIAFSSAGCQEGFCPAPAPAPAPRAVAAATATPPARPLILEDSPDARSLGEDGWIISGGARDAYFVRRDAVGGHPAWLLEPRRDTFGKYGTWMRHLPADALRGKRVRVSVAVRTEGASRRADFWARAQAADSPGDGLGLGGEMQSLPPDSDWTMHAIVMDVPASASAIEYGVGLAGPGRLWMDGAKAEVVGDDVPLSRPVLRSKPPSPPARSGVPAWDLSGDDASEYAASVDDGVKHAGRASGTLRSRVAAPKGAAALEQLLVPEKYRGKRVRMSAYVRVENVTGWVGLWMRVDAADPDRGWTAFDNMSERSLRGTRDWARYEIVLDVAPDARAIAFGMLLHGAGQAWIDDVVFDVVDSRVPTTGQRRTTKAQGENLDFEQ